MVINMNMVIIIWFVWLIILKSRNLFFLNHRGTIWIIWMWNDSSTLFHSNISNPLTRPQQIHPRWWRACGWVWQWPVREASQWDVCWWDDVLFTLLVSQVEYYIGGNIYCSTGGEGWDMTLLCFMIKCHRWHTVLVAIRTAAQSDRWCTRHAHTGQRDTCRQSYNEIMVIRIILYFSSKIFPFSITEERFFFPLVTFFYFLLSILPYLFV